jgi:hypothetical protein
LDLGSRPAADVARPFRRQYESATADDEEYYQEDAEGGEQHYEEDQ